MKQFPSAPRAARVFGKVEPPLLPCDAVLVRELTGDGDGEAMGEGCEVGAVVTMGAKSVKKSHILAT